MASTNPSVSELKAFAKYARPRPSHFLFLSICLELFYWLILLIILLIGINVILAADVETLISISSNLFTLICLGLIITLGRWRKRLRVNTTQALLREKRAPVLYLRSFFYETNDKSEVSQERRPDFYEKENEDEVLALAIRGMGPLIAIGKPEDKIPPLGALRLYFKDDEWKEAIKTLMSISQLIIIQSGYTSGTEWEMQQAKDLPTPDKVIYSFLSWQDLDREARQIEYGIFALQIKRIYGCDLPEKFGNAHFLYFDKELKPHLIGLKGWKAIFFGFCSLPNLVWRLLAALIFLPARWNNSLHALYTSLLKRLPIPSIFREYSVPGVREELRPILKASGIHLPIWRTAVFIFMVIAVLSILIGLFGWSMIVVMILAGVVLATRYLLEFANLSSVSSSPETFSLLGDATLATKSKKKDMVVYEMKFKKCLHCGLGNWHEATSCDRCGRELEHI